MQTAYYTVLTQAVDLNREKKCGSCGVIHTVAPAGAKLTTDGHLYFHCPCRGTTLTVLNWRGPKAA